MENSKENRTETTSAEAVLSILAKDDGFVSGSQLAVLLKISRNAVWKAVCSLKREGYRIESSRAGYRLLVDEGEFSAVSLQRLLHSDGLCIKVYGDVSSTNFIVKNEAEAGAPEGLCVLAASQSQGRGRLGRSFFSPAGDGLYMSLLLRPACPFARAQWLTALAAVCAAEAIRDCTGLETAVKWVNDIYVKGRKVCGILTEASADFENGRVRYAVLGIGVNLREPENGFPEEIAGTAGHLEGKTTAVLLAANFLNRFMAAYPHLEEKGFLDAYRSLSMLDEKDVTVQSGNSRYPARVLGISDSFGLLVRREDGRTEELVCGEVSVRQN